MKVALFQYCQDQYSALIFINSIPHITPAPQNSAIATGKSTFGLAYRRDGLYSGADDAVSQLDRPCDGAEGLEASPCAKDRHGAVVEHAPED